MREGCSVAPVYSNECSFEGRVGWGAGVGVGVGDAGSAWRRRACTSVSLQPGLVHHFYCLWRACGLSVKQPHACPILYKGDDTLPRSGPPAPTPGNGACAIAAATTRTRWMWSACSVMLALMVTSSTSCCPAQLRGLTRVRRLLLEGREHSSTRAGWFCQLPPCTLRGRAREPMGRLNSRPIASPDHGGRMHAALQHSRLRRPRSPAAGPPPHGHWQRRMQWCIQWRIQRRMH